VTLRAFRQNDEQTVLTLVNEAYRNLETLRAERLKMLTSPPYFNADGFFIAEEEGTPVGCIGVFNLPAEKCLLLQYLAVGEALSNLQIVDGLIKVAVNYASSKQPKLVKAVTPAVQPYVEAYQRFGFKPVRRILRIGWDLRETFEAKLPSSAVTVTEVREEHMDEASSAFVEGLLPYWKWYIEEGGGDESIKKRVAEWMRQFPHLAAKAGERIVGVVGVFPRLGGDEAAFSGVIVLPEFRRKGIGSVLMDAALDKARQLGCQRLYVHTMAYLDSLAPGAVLYLKSGGRIEAEYLHLVRGSEN
jgi:N-acetylglutamate synthase-like GNAT family acetyltransferase